MSIDPAFAVGEVDERVFGSFVEHMGRCVYGGIFEPGHPTAGEDGFRGDVLELVRDLGVTIVRYPGGNFVSGYDWEDGIGPRESRPRRLDLAWRSIETNQVGTDDFLAWTRQAGVEPMLAANMGTRGVDAARHLVEYCNAPAGTGVGRPAARRPVRRARLVHRQRDGRAVADRPQGRRRLRQARQRGGQGHAPRRPVDRARRLRQLALADAHLRGVGEHGARPRVGGRRPRVAAHLLRPGALREPEAFLAASLDLDRTIDSVAATADAVAARKRSRRRVSLSVDEWNVWYQEPRESYERREEPFVEAPPLIEDTYTVTDALVVGCCLITLLRHADRVRMACLAQLVNVIAPIRTENGGAAWRQTTYFPFQHAARHGRGTVLRVEPSGPTYATEGESEVPVLEATAVHDGERGADAVRGQPRRRAARAARADDRARVA